MKQLILLCLLVGLTSLSASAQHFHWVKTGLNSGAGPNIANGNNLIATITAGTTMPGHITPPFTLAVQDTSGNLLWAKSIFSRIIAINLNNNNVPNVAVDNNQDIVVAGSFRDSLYIGSRLYKAPAINGTMFFVAKFNTAGTMLWSRNSTFTATHNTSSVNTSTDAADNVYVSGIFSGTLTTGTTSITATGTNDAFLIKFDPNGNLLWAKATGTLDTESIVKSTVATNSSIYLAASVLNSGQTTKLLLTKFDTNGTLLWNKTISPAGNSNVKLVTDNANNLYVTGNYTGSIDFTGTFSLTSILNYQTFLAKFSPSGAFKWAKNIAAGNNFTTATVPSILYSATDNTLGIAGSFNGTALFSTNQLTSTPSGNKNGFIVKTDTAGTLLWTKIIPGSSGDNQVNAITKGFAGSYFIAGLVNGVSNFSGASVTSSGSQAFTAQLKAIDGNVTTGSLYNLVTGSLFLDANSNGVRDVNETGVPETFIGTSSNAIGNFVSPDGTYNFFLPSGSFTITPAPKKYYTFVPATHTVNLTGSNQTITGKDFALQAIPNQKDVRITLTASVARPGFSHGYFITYQNIATTTLSDTISFKYDPAKLVFNNSNTTPIFHQNGTIKWFYSNLLPYQTRNIQISFTVKTIVAIGSEIKASAVIKPIASDLVPFDNYDTTKVIVSGSFDPNDKQVDKAFFSPAAALQGDYLDYTIRFQNSGTDTAFTVVVSDKISEKYQLNTFEMLASSHPYILSVNGNKTLEWRFNNILLPDSNRNEPASHGFVRFRIKTKPGLLPGDSVANKAAIFFDFNTAVLTNYAITRISLTNGIKERSTNIQAFRLYPNPAKNYVMVAAEFRKNTTATVSLINLLGQTISKVTLPANAQIHYQMPLNELPKGVYLIRLETETGIQTQRLVIQ